MNFGSQGPQLSRRYQHLDQSAAENAVTVFETNYQQRIVQSSIAATQYHEALEKQGNKRASYELLTPRTVVVCGRVVRLTFDVSISTIAFACIAALLAIVSIAFYITLQSKVPDFDYFSQQNVVLRKQLIVSPDMSVNDFKKQLRTFSANEYNVGQRSHYSIDAATANAVTGSVHYLNRGRQIPVSYVATAAILEANVARVEGSVQASTLVLSGNTATVSADSLIQGAYTTFTFKKPFNFTQGSNFARLTVRDLHVKNMTASDLVGSGKFAVLNVSQITADQISQTTGNIGRLSVSSVNLQTLDVVGDAHIGSIPSAVADVQCQHLRMSGSVIQLENVSAVNSTAMRISGSEITLQQVASWRAEIVGLRTYLLTSNNTEIANVEIQTTESKALDAYSLQVTGKCTFESVASDGHSVVSSRGNGEFASISGLTAVKTDKLVVDGTFIGNITIS